MQYWEGTTLTYHRSRPRTLHGAAKENSERKALWREGVIPLDLLIWNSAFTPHPTLIGMAGAQKQNCLPWFLFIWLTFLKWTLPKVRRNRKGMSIRNTNNVKIVIFPKYKCLILRSVSYFVTGSWHGVTQTLLTLPPCSHWAQPWDLFPQAHFPGWGNKRWFRFPFRSCFLPGGILGGGTGRGRRSPLRWGNGLDLSQQASLSSLPGGLSGCSVEVRCLVGSLHFSLSFINKYSHFPASWHQNYTIAMFKP